MRAFAELSWRGQVGRLRRLARLALERFGLGVRGPLTCLGHWENATFRADLTRRLPGPAGPHHPDRVLVRVHRPGYQDAATIRSELAWLDSLQEDERLVVPLGLADPQGERVLAVDALGVPEARLVTILRWLPGPILGHGRRRRPLEQLRRMGESAARLHEHASAWRPPRSFRRRENDAVRVLGSESGLGPVEASLGRLTPAVRRRVERGLEIGAKAMTAAERETGLLLIHADLHADNLVDHPERLGVIDFDDCGEGSIVYDFATALSAERHRESWAAALAAYVEGYERVRRFDRGWLEHLDGVFVARLAQWMRWAGSRAADNPRFREMLPRWEPLVGRRLRELGA